MPTFDVVVVGGGPGGSTCARELTRRGLNVAVLDRAVFPRDKACAGWITPAVVRLLALDLDEYRQSRVLQPILGFRTGRLGHRMIPTHYPEAVSYGIRRCEFDHHLLQQSGAHLRCGQPVSTIERRADRWIVNGEISTPLLVGAGGHFCPVARRLNGAQPTEALVATLEMDVRLRDDQVAECRVEPETPELYFCDDMKGYGWCFRKANFLNVGLGRQDPHRLPEHARLFVSFLKSHHIVPPDLRAAWKGHAYLLRGGHARRCVDDGVILVGDAAGLAHPQSGEGIRPAIESGLLAAGAILATNGRYDRASLEPYQQLVLPWRAGDRLARRLARLVPAWMRVTRRVFEPFGLSVVDVENLRPHYAKTLQHWQALFDVGMDRVREMFDDRFVRAWRLYLAGSRAAFTTGWMQLFQVTFARGRGHEIPWSRG